MFHSNLKLYSFFLIIMTLLFWNCQTEKATSSPLDHIKDEQVKSLISKTMDATGGLENWKNIKSLAFRKYFALYDSLGNTEMEVNQIHRHSSFPKQDIYISWKKGNDEHVLQAQNEVITKTINTQKDTSANPTSLTNTIRSATFVMNIPFNLLDTGIDFAYEGFGTLEEGQEVEILRASYNPETHNNHSTKDIWWYYFDKKNHTLVGYMVKHADHYSYVKNLETKTVDGFVFPIKRKSWRVTKDREILYLRADYDYSDYQL